ncbi:MAG TPA: S9 family peptidase [Roseiflexaceae bacterium]|nr:S9 family peptidase [Roseiflexaceae bacterium]
MTEPQIAPYGAWRSPITTDLIVAGTITLGQITLDGADVYWTEGRPTEQGRVVLMRLTPDGAITELTPSPFNVRTRVHEYGGGAYAVHNGLVVFSHFVDNRLYRISSAGQLQMITWESQLRYADMQIDAARGRVLAVREDHRTGGEAVNTLVAVDLNGKREDVVLVSGHDFFSNPRLSPDGARLSWLAWDHPNLPWDGTMLWVAEIAEDGTLHNATQVAGGPEESIFQPSWSPDGTLHFVSDRTGWWNLYRWQDGEAKPIAPMEAEFGQPQWVFGQSTYGFAAPDQLICLIEQNGFNRLVRVDANSATITDIETPYNSLNFLNVTPERAYFLGASPTEPRALVQLDLSSNATSLIRRSNTAEIDPGFLSVPQQIEFPTENGQTAFAIYYPPANRVYRAPEGELPPLLVRSHGGPTGSADAALNLQVQYWTSRGFAFVDVNYGGSTGYGRAYRQRLNGTWGVVDVDDCINAARHLVQQGLADSNRLAIDGGSAGGYTTLCALTFRDAFKAGASLFGISELEVFINDTHKFESRYLDRLIGPYPERKDLYYERSPINFVDRLNCPMILLQGLDDKIVPPNQAELMRKAVRAKGLPVAYLPFAGEGHGFRKADSIKRALDAEFYFFSRIFGFDPADEIDPVEIENLPA